MSKSATAFGKIGRGFLGQSNHRFGEDGQGTVFSSASGSAK